MGALKYIGMGKAQPKISVDYSMNQGRSWQHKTLEPGQSLFIPPNCTNLLLDNIPYDPAGNYEIRDGKPVKK